MIIFLILQFISDIQIQVKSAPKLNQLFMNDFIGFNYYTVKVMESF